MTGAGLGVVLHVQNRPHHDWLSLAAWHSACLYVPDAAFAIRTPGPTPLFQWARKRKLVCRPRAQLPEPCLHVIPEFFWVRPLRREVAGRVAAWEGDWAVPPGEASLAPLADCRRGWGGFVLEDWIDNFVSPFGAAERYVTPTSSVLERKIASWWRTLESLDSSLRSP